MGAESLVQLTILSAATMGLHIYEFGSLNKCAPTYNLLSLADMVSLFVLCIAIWIIETKYETLAKCLTSISVVGLGLMSPPALYLLIKTMISTGKCIPVYLQKLDLSVLIFVVLMELVALCLFGCLAVAMQNEKKKREEAQIEFERVYEDILKPDFNLAAFLEKHTENVDKLGLSEKEIVILNDKFGSEFKEDQSEISQNEKKECAICLGEYEKGEHIIIHPMCNHTFHSGCLGHWLKNDKNAHGSVCPICRTGCRRAMLTQIRRTMFGDMDAGSTVSGPSTNNAGHHQNELQA